MLTAYETAREIEYNLNRRGTNVSSFVCQIENSGVITIEEYIDEFAKPELLRLLGMFSTKSRMVRVERERRTEFVLRSEGIIDDDGFIDND